MVGHFQTVLAKTLFNIGFGSKNINREVVHVQAEGTSGTDIFGGRYSEEYLQKLLGEDAITNFDEMRRSDGQVKMLLSVVKNPIRSASWAVEAVDDSDEEENIAAFAQHILFEDIVTPDGQKRKKFRELLTEILTCIDFGYSVFEKVHKVVKGHPEFGDYIGYADIGFRHQRSIEEWVLRENGSIDHIRQQVQGDLSVNAFIAGVHLMVCSIDKEGDNYEGISMLRPCYGAWFRKNLYKKFQAIGIERASLGMLHGEMSEEFLQREDWESQRSAFQCLLNQFSSHERNAIVTAPGLKINEVKLTHDAEKVQGAIAGENVEMSKAFLVTFMEMGIAGNGGSYSLGSDLSDIFLSGIEFLGDMIADKLNDDILKPVIDMKFGPRSKYPKLTHKGINDKAGEEFAKVMKDLSTEDLIQKSDRVKKHVHERYDLPAFDPDLEEELKEDDNNEDEENSDNNEQNTEHDDDVEQSSHRKKDKKKLSDAGFDDAYKEISTALIKSHGGKNLSAFEDHRLDELIYIAAADHVQLAELLPSVFIARNAQKLEVMLRDSMLERSDKMISKMVNIIRRDPAARAAALAVTMPDGNTLKKTLRSYTGEVAQKALNKVLRELNKTRSTIKLTEEEFRDLPTKTKQDLNQEIILTQKFLDSDMEKVVLFSFNGIYDETDSPDVIEQDLIRQRDRHMAGPSIRATSVNITAKTTNSVRNDVFQEPDVLDDIESFIFTNPAPVSAICQNLTGRVFSKEEYATTTFLPPLHHNCKSFIVAQTAGKKGNKSVDPNELQIVGTADQQEKARKSITL